MLWLKLNEIIREKTKLIGKTRFRKVIVSANKFFISLSKLPLVSKTRLLLGILLSAYPSTVIIMLTCSL